MKVLGIDIGTTTISFAVVDSATRGVEKAFTISNDSFLKDTESWEKIQDPEQIIRKTIQKTEEILQECPDIRGIGLTGQMHGIVYLNKEGDSVSPLYTWQDQRGNLPLSGEKSICKVIEEKTGIKAATGYGLITHLYNMQKGIVSKEAVQICTIMDYLGMKLTGRNRPVTHSSNAASFGFFDVAGGTFRKKELEIMGVDPVILPEVAEDFSILGKYQGIPVGVAIGDNQASFLGSVVDTENAVLVNMGTGGQISALSDTYFTVKGVETRPFSKGKYLLAGASLCGGRAYAILAEFFRLTATAMGVREIDPYAVMSGMLERYEATDTLQVKTTFSGTRENPLERGSVEQITEANFRPDALTYAVLDGMAQELYDMYKAMESGLTKKRTKMIASGNGLRRNPWLQKIMSQKFQMEIEMSANAEEAALGAAIAEMSAQIHI